MALDAIAIRALTKELQCLVGGRTDKVHQPERDEIVLSIRTPDEHYRLVISAGAAHPRIHLTDHPKKNPTVAPMFCMLLRKHLGSGKIVKIEQLRFERIVKITFESYNELGDLTEKYLIAEIMGRHSNIILMDENNRIIDSIKHVDESISSVREILPGLEYVLPPVQSKTDLVDFTLADAPVFDGTKAADKVIMAKIAGISPITAREIVYSVFGTTSVNMVNTNRSASVTLEIMKIAEDVRRDKFSPCLVIDRSTGKPMDFSATDIKQYGDLAAVERYSSMNKLADDFYYKRDMHERLRQKSADLTKLLNNNIERLSKKMSVLQRTLKDAEKRDTYKMNGDLITANIYRITDGMKELEAENFYSPDCHVVKIPLDPSMSPAKNAQRYYKKYNKAKTAQLEAAKQLKQSWEDLAYIESTLAMVENAESDEDISAIRVELTEQGYIKRHSRDVKKRRKETAAKPRHFVSADGFDIYVGRNNTQNDYLTLKFANASDLWFHTKGIHGSHTIIKLGRVKDVPKDTIVTAARIAAYYSKAGASSQVPVDYTTVKNVKKPNGAKPGMVIYDKYNTIYVTPGIDGADDDGGVS